MPSPPALRPASEAFWNSPLWNSTHASSTAGSDGNGSASPACSLPHCFFTLTAVKLKSPKCGNAVHLAMLVSLSSSGLGLRVRSDQAEQVHALALLQVRHQQVQHMMRAAQQCELRGFRLQCPARVAHVF